MVGLATMVGVVALAGHTIDAKVRALKAMGSMAGVSYEGDAVL